MQDAKDSFYEEVRGRLAAGYPERTMVVRGVTRPAILVDENEATSLLTLPDCFHVVWGAAATVREGALPEVRQACEIRYSTAGSPWNGGVDRGRLLAAMDRELLRVLSTAPQSAAKRSYAALASGGGVRVLPSRIWWSDVQFGQEETRADRVMRVARVEVMSFEGEGGEQ